MNELIPGDKIELSQELWEEILNEFENGVNLRATRRFDSVLEVVLEQLILNRGSLEIKIHEKPSGPQENQPHLF